MSRGLRALLCCGAAAMLAAAPPEVRPPRSSPITVTPDGALLAVANIDSASVSFMDPSSHRLIAEIAVGGTPQTIAADQSNVFVALREGSVVAIDIASRTLTGRAKLCVECFGVATFGGLLYVTDTGAGRVVVASAATLQQVASIGTETSPRGIAANPAAGRLYISHFRSGRLSVIDTERRTIERVVSTGPDSNLAQAVTIDADGRRLYMPETRSNSSNQALLFDTTVFPIVSVIDLGTGENLQRERVSIDIADRPVNMPLDAVITRSGKLYIVNAGSDDLSVIDLSRRVSVAHISVGSNPRGIALSPDERFAYVNNTLSGTISIINTSTDHVDGEVTSTRIPLPPSILNGKILFHASSRTTLSKDRWISCATCHFDGGHDGRTWFFRDGPRNTPAVFGVGETLPMHWSGDLDELQDVESTVRVVQAGTGLAAGASNCDPSCDTAASNSGRSKDLDDLAAFMRSLTPPPHPVSADFDAVSRGRALFNDPRVGCLSCHPAPLFTDRLKHNVGTGTAPSERKGSSFDTPSLRGIVDTAPYFHDGSAATLLDVVNAATGQHGNTGTLTPAEKIDLIAFLRSLAFPQPRRRAVGR